MGNVDYLVMPLIVLAMGVFFWLLEGGPQKVYAERRKTAEANARTEEAKLEQKKLDRDRERS